MTVSPTADEACDDLCVGCRAGADAIQRREGRLQAGLDLRHL